MDSATLAGKKQQSRDVTELLDHDGYQLLLKEIGLKKDEGIRLACDLGKSQSERDAGAGQKALAEYLTEYLPQLKRSLDSTIKKAGSSNKRARE